MGLKFLMFLRFSVYYAIYNNWCFEIFEVFSFNRADKAFDVFCPTGTRDTYNIIRRGPKQVATKVRPSPLRKLLEFLSGSVPKSPALFVTCVRSLGAKGGNPKTSNPLKDKRKTEQCDAQS